MGQEPAPNSDRPLRLFSMRVGLSQAAFLGAESELHMLSPGPV